MKFSAEQQASRIRSPVSIISEHIIARHITISRKKEGYKATNGRGIRDEATSLVMQT
ncbi:hypothetical protein SMAC4_14122 [Sordaria macrospora]|uniref:uncharacterized protein n=1 Tax=Sordaria macrospora TaxID=5147 RepID=UPI002B2A8CEE|nr:hypothetical protein SMAC4_14122 [Sordaria macrospora]